MIKALFQNSRIALPFVVLTVLGAVSMVGSQEESGLLPKVVSFAEAQRSYAGDAESAAAAPQPAPASVFGDYEPQQVASQPLSTPSGAADASGGSNPMTAPMSSNAQVSPSGPYQAAAEPDLPESAPAAAPQ
jgi:hypothetical protein